MKNFTFILCFIFINNILLLSQENETYKLKYLYNSDIKVHIDTLQTGVTMQYDLRHSDSTLVEWAQYNYREGFNIIFNKDGTLYTAGYCKRFISFKCFFETGHLIIYRKIGLWVEYDYLEKKYINHIFYVDKFKSYHLKSDKNGNIIGEDIIYNSSSYKIKKKIK